MAFDGTDSTINAVIYTVSYTVLFIFTDLKLECIIGLGTYPICRRIICGSKLRDYQFICVLFIV